MSLEWKKEQHAWVPEQFVAELAVSGDLMRRSSDALETFSYQLMTEGKADQKLLKLLDRAKKTFKHIVEVDDVYRRSISIAHASIDTEELGEGFEDIKSIDAISVSPKNESEKELLEGMEQQKRIYQDDLSGIFGEIEENYSDIYDRIATLLNTAENKTN